MGDWRSAPTPSLVASPPRSERGSSHLEAIQEDENEEDTSREEESLNPVDMSPTHGHKRSRDSSHQTYGNEKEFDGQCGMTTPPPLRKERKVDNVRYGEAPT